MLRCCCAPWEELVSWSSRLGRWTPGLIFVSGYHFGQGHQETSTFWANMVRETGTPYLKWSTQKSVLFSGSPGVVNLSRVAGHAFCLRRPIDPRLTSTVKDPKEANTSSSSKAFNPERKGLAKQISILKLPSLGPFGRFITGFLLQPSWSAPSPFGGLV